MQIILLDVEGTTTPINFVYGILFPFAKANIPKYIHENHDDFEVINDLDCLESERLVDTDPKAPAYSRGLDPIPYLLWLMDCDRKSPALKSLQGKVWERGYRDGVLNGEVFPDVPRAMLRWIEDGKKVSIYSSGSVLAQKLIFRFSDHGDLTGFISNYFDTSVGHKGIRNSYENIARSLGVEPREILFVSDVLSELEAASSAGCLTVLSIRPGNKPVDENKFDKVLSFDEL